jgi:bifunctional DNA-binding transcriptional regulator/antitoxin component of YhaV-PrlF toxin-antitoxin module
MALIKVRGRGRITIPEKFRKALGIETGCMLLLRQVGDQQFIVDVLPTQSLESFPIFDGEVDMAKIREEMGRDIAGRAYSPEVS